MRVDLIGGEDILAKVEALAEQQQDAQQARNDATEALRLAKRTDINDAAEALRAGAEAPEPKPQATKSLEDAERHLAIVTQALIAERKAWIADLKARDADIRMKLAEAEDATNEALRTLIAEAEGVLDERADIRAHVEWLDDTSRNISKRRVGPDPLASLRAAISAEPGGLSGYMIEKREHEARVHAWNELAKRAAATVPADQRLPVLDGSSDSGVTVPQIDAAIEREIERMIEAGEEVPVPVTKKWMQRLGTGKHKWAHIPVEKTTMPPDTESAEARRGDLVKALA
ncbi:MAG TPA: hypothetical protein VG053_03975 [Solirubrobacteraceae bacterium]|jgi:hypothetical protein|nr:hypothetical protein [Solirubrobacteraceae bacterium]